ncbi:MAG: ACT domain-containing protein [Phycisphaerae bacterium]|jgi:hypothetical protein
MRFDINRVDVWAGEVPDRRGSLANTLRALFDAGADLDFIMGRPSPVKPNTGILYVAPVEGEAQVQAAAAAGLVPSGLVPALRIGGPDERGLAERIARALSDAGINIAAWMAGRMADRCVMHLRFERDEDLTRAEEVLKEVLK